MLNLLPHPALHRRSGRATGPWNAFRVTT